MVFFSLSMPLTPQPPPPPPHPPHPVPNIQTSSSLQQTSLQYPSLRVISDLTIRQRQRLWKRHWKIDLAFVQTIWRLSQVTLLHERRQFRLDLKIGDRARVQTDMQPCPQGGGKSPGDEVDRYGNIFRLAVLTWDKALFSFRFENYIPAGKTVAVRVNVWEPLKLGLISGYAAPALNFT